MIQAERPGSHIGLERNSERANESRRRVMSINFYQTAKCCHTAEDTNPIAFSVAGLSVSVSSVETQYIWFVCVRSDANIAVEYNPDFLCVHYLVCGLSYPFTVSTHISNPAEHLLHWLSHIHTYT